LEQIDLMVGDSMVSRSIRTALEEVRTCLTNGECDLNVRKDDAQLKLSEMADDPNIPGDGRTVIWDVLSRIESL